MPIDPTDTEVSVPRPSWDEYFIQIAEVVSHRATCPRASVGVVIVSEGHRILSTGYNGAPQGEPHCTEVGCLIVDNHCQRALHAEVNAVAFAARVGIPINGARLYMYDSLSRTKPCRECEKVRKAAGVIFLG